MITALPDEVSFMNGPGALPRDNGELLFEAPWEGRAIAVAIALLDRLELPWDAFRRRLVDAIAQSPDRPYYESWATALESLVVALGITTSAELQDARPTARLPL